MKFSVRLTCLLTAALIGSAVFGAENEKSAEKSVPAVTTEDHVYDWVGFQWGLWAPAQIFRKEAKVYGLKLNTIYSKNIELKGLDLGVIAQANDAMGLQIAALNITDTVMGAQIAALNITDTVMGAQIGVVNSSDKDIKGLQLGAVNSVSSATGAQIGYVNISEEESIGAQIGIANISPSNFCGTQIGFINTNGNSADNGNKKCFQIGFLNFNKHGFLPFTILFNF